MTEQLHEPGPGDPKYVRPGGGILDDPTFARLDVPLDELDGSVELHESETYAIEGSGEDLLAVRAGTAVKSRGQWAQAARRFVRDKAAMLGGTLFLTLVLSAVINSFINPNGYLILSTDYLTPPSSAHWFGTTQIGIDLFQACMQGLLVDLQVAAIVASVATVTGVLVGSVAGYFGGRVDAVAMQVVNLILMVPTLVILIVLSDRLKASSDTTILLALLIAAVSWTYMARLVRAEFLSLRKRDFIEAARALGATRRRIIFRHMLPNSMGPILVNAMLTMAAAVLLESTLSFLGLGIQPPQVSLGGLLFAGQDYATVDWWVFVFPAALLLLLILSIFLVGDGLQAAMDPRKNRARS
jgi:peptide/nickel transport system permease protein